MFVTGESQKEAIRPVFNRAIMIDFPGRQGFLPCPAVVCPCSLGFSSIAPLSNGAGLGSLSSFVVRYPGSDG